ncbi:MAG: PIG-L deacetylase family protein, partial [Acidimicrobiales bacterium]
MKVLAIGAHPDDVEIGCGAALLAHKVAGDDITLLVMSDGRSGTPSSGASRGFSDGSRIAEQEEAAAILGAELIWGGFRDGSVPDGPEAVGVIDDAVRRSGADLVYTHAERDSHQDHRV